MAIESWDKIGSDEEVSAYQEIFESAVDGLIVSDAESGVVINANPAACKQFGYTWAEIIGCELSMLIHPEARRSFNEQLRAYKPGTELDIWTRHVSRDGVSAHSRWRAGGLRYEGRACLLWIVRDVSQRIRAEQVRAREQDALLEVSRALASSLEFHPGTILDELRQVVEYSRAGFFGLENSAFVTLAMRGTAELEKSPHEAVQLQGIETLTSLFGHRKPIRIGEITSSTRQARLLRSILKDHGGVLLAGMHSWMWVPLAVNERVIAALGMAHEKRDFFTAHHAALALSVANQAAVAMINAELYSNAQVLAAMQERQRLAQSLHDAVNQSLFSAGLIAEILPRIWDQGQEVTRQSLEELHRLTRGAMAEMRGLLAELRPSTLTESELGDLLHLLGNAFTGRTNIPAKVTVNGEGSLPPETQVTIYRICQEAINNVAKHAGATSVEISLDHRDNGIDLRICDDGCGFDVDRAVTGNYGVLMMRERADQIGAQFSLESQAGHGTQVRICWPKDLTEDAR